MGTTQNSRSLPALRSGWLAIDSRSPRRLLADSLRTAALFNYFDSTGPSTARWDRAYACVPLVRYASLAEIDVDALARTFRALLARLQNSRKAFQFNPRDRLQLAAVRAIVSRLLELYRRLDGDARAFARFPDEVQFSSSLDHAITQVFAANYQTVFPWRRWLESESERRRPPLPADLWGTPRDEPPGLDPRPLYRAIWPTIDALKQLVAQARQHFARLDAAPQNLPPPFALYLAFARQFAGAQATLNTLPTVHRDYFFSTVLEMQRLGAQPDRAFVAFTAAPQSRTRLPSGTQLTAGKDAAGAPIVYATASATDVTNATLAQIATIWIRAPATAPTASSVVVPSAPAPDGSPVADPRGFYVAPRANSTDGLGAPLAPGATWAPFGEEQFSNRPRTMADATLGFAVSSPTLHLEEGSRVVTLTVHFAATAAATIPLPPDAFALDYTSTTGWASVNAVASSFAVTLTPQQLVIGFTLPAAAPPCVNYSPKLHGPAFASDTPAPILRALYNASPVAPPAPFLSGTVTTIDVTVNVTGVRNLTLQGPTGKLTPGKPLPLFGSPAQLGATLLIGCVEVFRKRLTSLRFNVTWLGLPTDAQTFPFGLSSYYASYIAALDAPPLMFCNASYGAAFAALTGGAVVPLAADLASLFAWDGQIPPPHSIFPPIPFGALHDSISWNIDASALPSLPPLPGLAGPLAYTPASGDGFFSVSLSAPPYLFGQSVYASVLSHITMQNGLALIKASRPPLKSGAAGASSATAPVPPASPSLRAAHKTLRAPAALGVFARIARVFAPKLAAVFTFVPELFAALKNPSAIPAAIAHAVEAAHGVGGAELPTALASLAGQRFTDPASLVRTVAQAAGLDPSDPAHAKIATQLTQALAALVPSAGNAPANPDASAAAPNSAAPASGGASSGAADDDLPFPQDLIPLPPPPLVPTAASFTLDYDATTTITLPPAGSPPPASPAWDRLWQISPFSTCPIDSSAPLLPAFAAGGYLYLGFAALSPPETLSLLVVVENLSARALEALGDTTPAQLRWSCLIGDRWSEEQSAAPDASADFDANAVHDGTLGFRRTGIVRFALPSDVDTAHRVMPAGLVWVRIHAPDPSTRLRVAQIFPHAAEVAWVPPAGASNEALAAHFTSPLPAGALNALVRDNPIVTQIAQPLPSSGGAPPEDSEQFSTRVSERLRHKGRAVAAPDYERLLLAARPDIFFVTALPPRDTASAGTTTLLVLPKIATPPVDPPPVFLPGDLTAMADALRATAPISANVVVVNPHYEWLTVTAQVVFRSDQSFQFYAARLSADLNAFISPWLYAQATVTQVERSFRLSALLNFVRRLDYVRLLASCQVAVCAPAASLVPLFTADPGDGDPLIQPTRSDALLIGVAQHDLAPPKS
ncbi:MAG: baseplate J/gp47 family protein [Opitutae bacterium]|nr:baseplate J/gp47 family protein [Opitutae bacterium]